MRAKTEATIEDLYHVPENGKAELVNGEIIFMSPTGFLRGYAAGEIFVSLRDYARRREAGYAVGDNFGFIVNLPNRRSFSPDAAFFIEQLGKPSMKFIEGAPIFAVDVRSEGDYGPAAEREIADKRADYFAAGTLVVCDVDLLNEDVVREYRASDPDSPVCHRRGDIAMAEPALPGWSMPADDLFPTNPNHH